LLLFATVYRKYYPVVQGGLPDCEKAFMNVLAYSTDEEYSIVCCDGDDHSTASICGSKVRDVRDMQLN
jgi:hypothetical protein